jgi:DNA invertase Pin-like site-specific DNA recombinase
MNRHAPPVPPRAVTPEDVPRIDAMIAIGMKHRSIAYHLGCHPRTVSNIACRKGAYKNIPPYQPPQKV